MSRFLPLCALTLAASLAGCSGSAPQAAAPTSRPAPAPSPGPSVSSAVDEPPGTVACGKISEAVRAGTLMQPGVVTDVKQSTATADAPVADAAGRLQETYERAVKAHGQEDEPDRVAAVSAAAAEMVSVCADSGLETAG